MTDTNPSEPPPSYTEAISPSNHPKRNGIPHGRRRSMEDEQRPLPQGWVRQFDPQSQHQFSVDTTKSPPRSIWHHPYDDEEYLASLSPDERAHTQRLHKSISPHDIQAESSDEEGGPSSGKQAVDSKKLAAGSASSSQEPKGVHKFGRKMKDKLTSTTHEQREAERRKREEQEHQAYQMHLQARRAMMRAMETGQPQFLCKGRDGRDIYIEPPQGPAMARGAYGYNPYADGPYANPNNRFIRPETPYNRPYGYGFPLMGGLLGGALLGGLLF